MISEILGKKLGMTQVYDAQNVLIPVSVVQAGPCSVVQIKTVETDGYHAVQLGFAEKKTKNTANGELGHAKKAGLDAAPRVLAEVRLTTAATIETAPHEQLHLAEETKRQPGSASNIALVEIASTAFRKAK